ncbi:transketolase [candidate division WOR-3 bacterium]|uniref:Transketolase n=1 Tax=candidate division WOR-3 bacterium TaxID=2052148 RepID=A0A660SIM5_UNCW3|nr:MAG: transketolase [candidate division WOR-3 bacterium]
MVTAAKRSLSSETLKRLKGISRLARGDILKMTTLAGSGHPGGSMSSLDIYLVVFSFARIEPNNLGDPERDRIVISHGHTSPGLYAALGRLGFLDIEEAVATFRRLDSIYEGHIERMVPGVEWTTGNLGQGLSAGCGFALAAKILGRSYHTYVIMSDGEQAKGQVAEARRFAKKYRLNDLTVIIDYNQLQISGSVHEVMPVNIRDNYLSDGWKVLEIDGHDYQEIHDALIEATEDRASPYAIIAHTIMGKGVSFMENRVQYHGKALKEEELASALAELNLENDLEKYRNLREKITPKRYGRPITYKIRINPGQPRNYDPETKIPNRTAFGNALRDIARLNHKKKGRTPIVVFDCDLTASVRSSLFAEVAPEHFFQAGVQEHNTATIAGAISTRGIISVMADFGVFGIDEVYNQMRLNDLNHTNLKLILTHLGVDVGPDGKTHHCIDYLGLLRNLVHFKVIIPADPNQTDRVIRYIVTEFGNFMVGMGRSADPVILSEDGAPFFGSDYRFSYGRADLLRHGSQAAIITMGKGVYPSVLAADELRKEKIEISVYNFSTPFDLDHEAITAAAKTGLIITIEDHLLRSGLGSIISSYLADQGIMATIKHIGIPTYAGSDHYYILLDDIGISVPKIIGFIKKALKERR